MGNYQYLSVGSLLTHNFNADRCWTTLVQSLVFRKMVHLMGTPKIMYCNGPLVIGCTQCTTHQGWIDREGPYIRYLRYQKLSSQNGYRSSSGRFFVRFVNRLIFPRKKWRFLGNTSSISLYACVLTTTYKLNVYFKYSKMRDLILFWTGLVFSRAPLVID